AVGPLRASCARYESLRPLWGERVDWQVIPCHGGESQAYRLPGVDSYFILGRPFVVETTPGFPRPPVDGGQPREVSCKGPLLESRISRPAMWELGFHGKVQKADSRGYSNRPRRQWNRLVHRRDSCGRW